MKKSQLQSIIREEAQKALKEMDTTTTGDTNLFDDIPAVDLHIDDSGNMSITIQAMYHNSDNGKVAVLQNNPHLRDEVVKILQIKAQQLFRAAIHGVAGEPYGLK